MRPIHREEPLPQLREALTADCRRCRGLCCAALYRARAEGFPADLPPGRPCPHLDGGYRCAIHGQLTARGLHGCTAYDCLGAGQRAAATSPADWRRDPEEKERLFARFLSLTALHQMLWYLAEVASLLPARFLWEKAQQLIGECWALGEGDAPLDAALLERQRARVNRLLRPAHEQTLAAAGGRASPRRNADCSGRQFRGAPLRGRDFSMALLLGADLSGCDLWGSSFLGADLRGADLRGADLRGSIFLTPIQLGAARGDGQTRLPPFLSRPASWDPSPRHDGPR